MPAVRLPVPERRRPALAALGYVALTFGPTALSTALVALVGAVAGVIVPLVAVFVGLMLLRQANVFVVSTLYHRSMSHRAFRFHPGVELPMRVWGWLFLGPGVRTWALIHRWHHATTDTSEDPHSPCAGGGTLANVTRRSVGVFRATAHDASALQRFARDLPDDALERFIQGEERRLYGMLGLRLPVLLGLIGACYLAVAPPLVALALAVASLPGANGSVLASTVLLVNGFAHTWGYRNFDTPDGATNLVPIDLFGWGEALHQNHHAAPRSASMAVQAWEWDPGFTVLRLMARVGLVRGLRGPRAVTSPEA